MPGFAKRLDKARVAPTVTLTVRARALRDAGADVITLTIGEPDFDTPPHAVAAAHAAALRAAQVRAGSWTGLWA
jgi:aspartate aminotransferase